MTKIDLHIRVDKAGAKAALQDRQDWTFLDCDIYIWEDGEVYYEISHHKFWFDHAKLKRDASCRLLKEGNTTIDSYDDLTELWNGLIHEYKPDEHFVEQFNEKEGHSYQDDNDYLG